MKIARRPLPIDPRAVPARAVVLMLLLAGCARPPAERAAPAGSSSAASPFSREAFTSPPGEAGAGELPVPTTPDPAALDEILAAAPQLDASAPVERRLGTDTGVPGDAGAAPGDASAQPARGTRIHIGKVTLEPGMSSPSIERAARAQLYWPLVQRCRAPDGAILPPEVVHLAFHLDRDGYVVPATILAVPKDPRFAEAARCMARELSMASFRAPAAARGQTQDVTTDVPSVD